MKAVRKPNEVEMRSMAPGVGHCSGGDEHRFQLLVC